MAKFLFTMLPANDLGLPTRLVPIARALADRGHAQDEAAGAADATAWVNRESSGAADIVGVIGKEIPVTRLRLHEPHGSRRLQGAGYL